MNPLITIAATAAANMIGGYAQNQQQIAASREQMKFQERMRDTQYQSAVRDLRAAGLNPMLAYNQGGNAAPGGSMPSIENVVGPAINNAMAAKRLTEEIKLIRQQAANVYTDTFLKAEQVETQKAMRGEINARTLGTLTGTALTTANAAQAGANTALLRANLPGASNRAKFERRMGMYSPAIELLLRSMQAGAPYFSMMMR